MSAARPPGADILDKAGGCLKLTQIRSLSAFQSAMVNTFAMIFQHRCMGASTIRQYRQ